MFFEQPFETAPKKKRNKVIWDKSEESDDEFIRKDNVEQPFETAPKKKKNKVIQDKSEENDETSNKRSIRSSNKQQKIKNQYNLLKQWTKVIAKEEMKLKNLFFWKMRRNFKYRCNWHLQKSFILCQFQQIQQKNWTLETGDEIVPFEYGRNGFNIMLLDLLKNVVPKILCCMFG